MERRSRTITQEHEIRPPQAAPPHETKNNLVALRQLKCPLSWRPAKGAYYNIRRYYIGAQQFAFVQDWGAGRVGGRFVVFINSKPGNRGSNFDDEDSLHEFFVKELARTPTP